MSDSHVVELVRQLKLQPHPEGGYFRETYRCEEAVAQKGLPERFTSARSFSTAIYYLLEGTQFSAFHRIRSDELWHFYAGSSMTIHCLTPAGEYRALLLGNDLLKGQRFQLTVPAGWWFAATVDDDTSFSLVGCTVAPGFDFEDFEMASCEELSVLYPGHEGLIRRLTRNG